MQCVYAWQTFPKVPVVSIKDVVYLDDECVNEIDAIGLRHDKAIGGQRVPDTC